MSLIESEEGISALLKRMRTIAVLGIKTSETGAPAFFVPEFAQRSGMRVIPVPVYFPDVTEILGEKVYRRLADIPEALDAVVIFRRPKDIPAHLDDILAAHPKVVWMQLGIRHDIVAAALVAAGIDVVQDRCLMVELEQRD
jgi:hypothetical protein